MASTPRTAAEPADATPTAEAGPYLTLEQIQTAKAGLRETDDVDVPALGGKVKVRRLSLGEMRAIAQRVLIETKGEGDNLLVMYYTAHAALVEPRIPLEVFDGLVDEVPGLMMAIAEKAEQLTAGLNPATVQAAEATFRKMG